jgi:hypothetical protein
MLFCSDVDILKWEPNLLADAAFASQLLMTGTGNLSGSAFTIGSGSFSASHVEAGQVIVLAGAIAGCYPIVSVDGATQLTLSVLYEGLAPTNGSPAPSPIGTASDLTYSVRTFWAQRKVVSDVLSHAAGVGPESARPDGAVIMNPEALRRACAMGTMQLIYSALAAASAEPGALNLRALMYERQYRRAIERARVEVDLDGDGRADVARMLNVLELKRA